MARTMNTDEIVAFVDHEFVARIGCHVDGHTYVVPVAYAWREGAIYGFSHEGTKLEMMRTNPRVCVEIDAIEHLGSWKSVIAWGTFEELGGPEAEAGRAIAVQRLGALASDLESRRRLVEALGNEPKPVIYRIRLDQLTGRVEGT